MHLGAGQVGVLLDRELLTQERLQGLDEAERESFQLLRDALAYGASLGLDATTSYRHLIDRDPNRAVSVVVASPAERLEAVSWWFPITGRVAYRGYFDAEKASRFAAELRADGYDTYVRRAALYSTLGFFDDPVPREMLGWPAWAVVDTVLHELVHETVFVAGDVAYNESLATFIAHQATLHFLSARERVSDRDAAQASFRDDLRFADLLEELRIELEALYEKTPDPALARQVRAEVFARHQSEAFDARPWETRRYDRFRERELNNAYVVANRTYLGDLPCLEEQLARSGDDLARLIAKHVKDPGREAQGCAP